MARKLRSYVKFIPRERRVILLTLIGNVGTITVADGTVTLNKTQKRAYRSNSHTIIPVGDDSTLSAIMVIGEYANEHGVFDRTPDDKLTPTSAQIQTTVTNDPPGPPQPIPYDIDETEENP